MTDFVRFARRRNALLVVVSFCLASWSGAVVSLAQSVGLPAPRLLTTMPMGGRTGSRVEIKISGEYLDDSDQLVFSDHRITTTSKLDAAGRPEPEKYVVTIA